MKMKSILSLVAILAAMGTAQAQITDMSQWQLVEDPAHPLFTASQNNVSVTLTANSGGTIPHATDIGYNTIGGTTFANSVFGYGFDPSAHFKIMVDFDLKFLGSNTGGLAIGFGVGEDEAGDRSAGVTLLTYNGVVGGPPTGFLATSRANGSDSASPFFAAPYLKGSFSVEYYPNTGTIFAGIGDFGENDHTETVQISNIQQQWGDAEVLFPSVFMRSDNVLGTGVPFSTDSEAEVVFSNFRIISGTPIRAVPEPSTYAAIFGVIALSLALWRRKRAR